VGALGVVIAAGVPGKEKQQRNWLKPARIHEFDVRSPCSTLYGATFLASLHVVSMREDGEHRYVDSTHIANRDRDSKLSESTVVDLVAYL
jgi:hypothetical protein